MLTPRRNVCLGAIGKDGLIEVDMTRDYDAPGMKIKASVPFVITRVAEKDAGNGEQSKLVGSSNSSVGIA